MHAGNGCVLACQQAKAIRSPAFCSQSSNPCLTYFWIIFCEATIHAKDDIATCFEIFLFGGDAFDLLGLFRIPMLEKSYNGMRHGTLDMFKEFSMHFRARFMTSFRPFRFSLRRNAEDIVRIVAEELRTDARRTFCGLWNHHFLWYLYLFLSTCLGILERQHPQRRPILRELKRPADFRFCPAIARCAPGLGFPLIILYQLREDHRSTSTSRTSSTPPWMAARKNIGWMFLLSR